MSDRAFVLSAAEHEAIYQIIESDHFADTRPVEKPVAIILGGQPGSGKSGLLEASKQDFAEGNVVAINGDELRYYHPEYLAIQRADAFRFAELTDPHARLWTRQLFDRASETRRNLVFEATMRERGPITESMARLRATGYRVIARVIAANECDSVIGIHRRYEEQRAAKGFGRWSNLAVHDAAYQGLSTTIDRLEIYDRRGRVIYCNELRDESWDSASDAAKALKAERERPATPEESNQRESEWNTIIAMMSARCADQAEIERVKEVALRLGGSALQA